MSSTALKQQCVQNVISTKTLGQLVNKVRVTLRHDYRYNTVLAACKRLLNNEWIFHSKSKYYSYLHIVEIFVSTIVNCDNMDPTFKVFATRNEMLLAFLRGQGYGYILRAIQFSGEGSHDARCSYIANTLFREYMIYCEETFSQVFPCADTLGENLNTIISKYHYKTYKAVWETSRKEALRFQGKSKCVDLVCDIYWSIMLSIANSNLRDIAADKSNILNFLNGNFSTLCTISHMYSGKKSKAARSNGIAHIIAILYMTECCYSLETRIKKAV